MSDVGGHRIVDRLLAHLEKNGQDERLRELAAAVRQGNAKLRDVLNHSEYAEALLPGLATFVGWYDGLSESERAEHAEGCQRQIDHINRTNTSGEAADQCVRGWAD